MHLALFGKRFDKVRNLSGFRKTHRVPEAASASSDRFITSLATAEIAEDLEKVRAALRSEYRFKRKELQLIQDDSGTGAIVTPLFSYSISVGLNEEEPSEVIWHRQVSEINDPNQLLSDSFTQAFGDLFDSLDIKTETETDIESIIDQIEELEDDRLSLDYDAQATWCQLNFLQLNTEFMILKNSFTMKQRGASSAKQLLETFLQLEELLEKEDQLHQLLFKSSG